MNTLMRVIFPPMALLAALPLGAANVVHLANGRNVPIRTIRWNAASKEYVVQTASGGDMTMNIEQKDVAQLEIDEPAEIAQAKELLKASRNLEAVPILERVVSSYRMLNWDIAARVLLARIYIQNKESAKAVTMVEELIASGNGRQITAELRQKYWEALQASGEKDKVAKDLDDAIATGPRELVPVAQVMRGNIELAAGKQDEALDDFLRTVLFFENAGPVRAEAMTKAVAILEKLNDPRARDLRQKLIQQYPDSDLAKKAGEKV